MRANLWAISSASAHKDGAWEFIRFLLSEEVQAAEETNYNWYSKYPVNKACFDICGARAIAEGSIIKQDNRLIYPAQNFELLHTLVRTGYKELFDPTEERVARIKAALEAAEPSSSFRTDKIMSIIKEEAGAYFAGEKSIEEVAAIIQNRVQLYIDEHR